jgi:hypothetical protein
VLTSGATAACVYPFYGAEVTASYLLGALGRLRDKSAG